MARKKTAGGGGEGKERKAFIALRQISADRKVSWNLSTGQKYVKTMRMKTVH